MAGLIVQNLYKSYCAASGRYEVNKNICFSAEQGSFIWIYGNSGAGKSTFLNVISGIDTPDSGTVTWNGTALQTQNAAQRAQFRLAHCGLIFQFFELIKAQSVYDNAALPLKIRRKSKKEIDSVLLPLFEYFEIRPLLRKKPDQLSGGEKQRVSIVRALSTHPQYIIADEITSSLDLQHSHQAYEYLHRYIKTNNGIGIFVSHDPVIGTYADTAYAMQNGDLTEKPFGDT